MLVLGLDGPVEDREQELQVAFDHPVGHRLAARPDPARAPLPDEAVPVALRQRFRSSVPAEKVEKHPRRGPVPVPDPLHLGRRHLFTVDVEKPLQGERLGLGFRLALIPSPPDSTVPLLPRQTIKA